MAIHFQTTSCSVSVLVARAAPLPGHQMLVSRVQLTGQACSEFDWPDAAHSKHGAESIDRTNVIALYETNAPGDVLRLTAAQTRAPERQQNATRMAERNNLSVTAPSIRASV